MGVQSVHLETDSRVAVIGGGPAGCFFALYLLRFCAERGIRPEVTIYQKHADEPGPKGCKGCAGILALSLLKNLTELGLTVPPGIVQSRIDHYAVHTPHATISISNPDQDIQIVSIYRGAGPQGSHYEVPVSFDSWLLAEARQRGATVMIKPVSRIRLEDNRPQIEVAGEEIEADLVVLSTGVNARPIPISGLNYVPPRTEQMAQDELWAGAAQVQSSLGNSAHAFLIPGSGLVFGTLVPKGEFINVSVLRRGQRPVSVDDLLGYDIVRNVLPEPHHHTCGCQPRAAVGMAASYYANRFVAVGDAAVSRLYKDGIGSALLTARQAARTAVYHGISRQEFARHYQPLCRQINRDNRWGRLLFAVNDKLKDSRVFVRAQQRLIGDEQGNFRGSRSFTKAVWGMFTGSYSYGSIIRMVARPPSFARLLSALFWESLGLLTRPPAARRRLHVGSKKVLILGSGFGGTYVLRHLVPALNRNENVDITMVSNENFFLFSPLLHEVAMGAVETRHVAYPIRRLHWRDRFRLMQTNVTGIDLNAREVTTDGGTLSFDYLVIALGSIANTSELVASGNNIFTLKTLRDSVLIRNHIISVFERASLAKTPAHQRQLLTFVVAGAGYVGIQLVTELRDFIFHNLIKFYRDIDPRNVRIMLVEVEPRILTGAHPRLADYVVAQLRAMGIETLTSSRVTGASDGSVEINGDQNVPASTLIWVAGVLASPQVAGLNAPLDSIGRVMVNERLEIPGFPGVYAVGDCAHFKDPRSGQAIPPRAHTAVRQAKVVAHNILAELRGRDKKPYRYSQNTEMVSLGTSRAILRLYGLRIYGIPARVVWLVSYSFLITGLYNRIRVIMDWLLSYIFGRDTTLVKLKE